MSDNTHSTELAVASRRTRRRQRDERGMTTAEYAVGTVAAASFGGVLFKILTDPQIQKLILDLLTALLKALMKVPGV